MDKSTLQAIALQLRRPQGEYGTQIGERMNVTNRYINLHTIDALELKNGDTVLEVGPGNGFFVKDILSAGDSISYTGCDFSELMVEEATRNNLGFVDEGRAVFHLSSADKLPLEDGSFDKVFTINTVYFWEDPKKVLAEFKRVMKPAGELLIAVRPKHLMEEYPFTKYGFNLYSNEELEKMLTDNGFTVVETIEKDEPDQEISGVSVKVKTLIVKAVKNK